MDAKAEDGVLSLAPDPQVLTRAERRTFPASQCSFRQSHHETVSAPVSDVQESIEDFLHQRLGIAAEVAVVVHVDETRRSDVRPAGNRAKAGHLLLGEGPFNGPEFVILIFAHQSSELESTEFQPAQSTLSSSICMV